MAENSTVFKNKQLGKKVFFSVLVIGALILTVTSYRRYNQSDKQLGSVSKASNSQNSQLSTPVDVNQQIQIPLAKDEDEAITYQISTAELKSNIVLRGQEAKAVEGKKFLILNLKLNNPEERRVKLDTRDFVRLSVNGGEDRLAPSIHNDPVELQPISDQYTRIGFSVNAADQNFILYLGQISEDKIEIPLAFE